MVSGGDWPAPRLERLDWWTQMAGQRPHPPDPGYGAGDDRTARGTVTPFPAQPAAESPGLSLGRAWPERPPRPGRAHNLPASPTPLIGREHETAGARRQLLREEVRLLTLVGPPGIGKTRLSIEAAQGLVDYFERGVRFVSLAPIRDPGLVASAIAQTVGVREAGDRPLSEILAAALREQELLLVLDNFEHV